MPLGLGKYRRVEPPETQLDHVFQAPYVFEGGARLGWANWSIPFARMTADPAVIAIVVRKLPFGHGPVWIERSVVSRVVRVQGCLISPGILFESESGVYDGVIFWTMSPTKVLGSLKYLGWPTGDSSVFASTGTKAP